jgi:hypothetical protein
MTRYRDRSAVPDWALLALMAAAMACGGEQAKVGRDQRAVPITSPSPNDATGAHPSTVLGSPRVETTES